MKKAKVIIIALIPVIVLGIILFIRKDNSKITEMASTNMGVEIYSVEKVKIGGIDQWIYITGKDTSKPVLLFLHGGPGYSMMPLLHQYNSELENYFTVVNWDQRGAGLSYSEDISESSMTLEQFVSDTHELTAYLKKRFNQKKIYLAGHSFGTIFGLKAASKYPEDYFAFIGIGQVVSFAQNEQLSYDFALKAATEADNDRAINELTRVGRPDENGRYKNDIGYEVTIGWVEYFGGSIYGKESIADLQYSILNSDLYKDEKYKIESGWEFSQLLFEDEEVVKLDFRNSIKSVKVPVYFFAGVHDYETPSKLVEEYYNILTAPKKELIWFENSAHFPFYEEPSRFNDVMINKVLYETYEIDDLSGVWKGTYTAYNVASKITLKMQKTDTNKYMAEFSFETTDYAQNKITGSYKMLADFNQISKYITFSASEWINQPPGYDMINMAGIVSENSMTGSIYLKDFSAEVGAFAVTRTESSK